MSKITVSLHKSKLIESLELPLNTPILNCEAEIKVHDGYQGFIKDKNSPGYIIIKGKFRIVIKGGQI